MSSPRILHTDHALRLATWQNVVVSDIAGEVDLVRMQRIARACRDVRAAHPGGIVTCALVREGTPLGSQAVRDEAARLLKDLGGSIHRMAVVIEAQGVMTQVLRTVVRGLNVISRNSRLALFGTVPEAVDALAPFVAPSAPGAEVRAKLGAALEEIRRDFRPAEERVAAR